MCKLFPALLLATVAAQPGPAAAGTLARWIEYGPGSTPAALAAGTYGDAPTSLTPTILARAVITDAAADGHTCPAVTLDHAAPLPTRLRFIAGGLGAADPPFAGTATARFFANGTPMATTDWGECEAVIPPGHAVATIDGTDLPLPSAHPRRILVMADTGCRMNGPTQQNCADPAAFPWAYLAQEAAALHPDLILHVGDWLYRDSNCLSGGAETFPGCNTPASANYEPWGDTFDAWNADVLIPARTLLATAPWIMVRGNHESCGRGARGWFALLDPRPLSPANIACTRTAAYPPPGRATATYTADFEPSYVVPAGDANILVHDSSFANDRSIDRNIAASYDIDLSRLLAAVTAASPRPNIVATHKPTFGLVYTNPNTGCTAGGADNTGDVTEQSVVAGGTGYAATAFAHGVPPAIALFVSGHIHQFQYVNFADPTIAPQLIVGTGGTLLDRDCTTGHTPDGHTDLPAFTQAGVPFIVNRTSGTSTAMADTYAHDEFGFAMLEAAADGTGYTARIYKISAAIAGTCRILFNPRAIRCAF